MREREVVDHLLALGYDNAAKAITRLYAEARKAKASRARRPNVSTPMTDTVRDEIRRLHLQFPNMTNHEIAAVVRVNQGRVAETLNGR